MHAAECLDLHMRRFDHVCLMCDRICVWMTENMAKAAAFAKCDVTCILRLVVRTSLK